MDNQLIQAIYSQLDKNLKIFENHKKVLETLIDENSITKELLESFDNGELDLKKYCNKTYNTMKKQLEIQCGKFGSKTTRKTTRKTKRKPTR